MKRVVLSVTIALGAIMYANAAEYIVNANIGVVTFQEEDGFVEVKFEALNEKVQKSIKELEEVCNITDLAYNKDKKQTKVNLIVKENNAAKVVILDDEGKEVTEKEAAK